MIERPDIERWKEDSAGGKHRNWALWDIRCKKAIAYIEQLEIAMLQELKCHGNCACDECQDSEQVFRVLEEAYAGTRDE